MLTKLKDILREIDYQKCETGQITDITELLEPDKTPFIYKVELTFKRSVKEKDTMEDKVNRVLIDAEHKIEGLKTFLTTAKDKAELKAQIEEHKTKLDNLLK